MTGECRQDDLPVDGPVDDTVDEDGAGHTVACERTVSMNSFLIVAPIFECRSALAAWQPDGVVVAVGTMFKVDHCTVRKYNAVPPVGIVAMVATVERLPLQSVVVRDSRTAPPYHRTIS